MRRTVLLSVMLTGLAAQAQAAKITFTDSAGATPYAAAGTKLTGLVAAYETLGGTSVADAVTTLTSANVALLHAPENSFLDEDGIIYPQVRYSPAPIPEPSTLPLVAGSLATLAFVGLASRRAAVSRLI